jgi:hypothetical protein
MAKIIQGTEVVLRAKKDYVFRVSLPRSKDTELIFKFVKSKETPEDGFLYCTIPVEINYKDDYGKEKNFHKNYAQFIYDTYEGVEVVEVVEKPIMDAPVIDTTKKKKEKKNEKQTA